MRRSCFYMNMKFTQRHLNAIRSPLMTGYVNATGLSMTQSNMAVIPGQQSLISSTSSPVVTQLLVSLVEGTDVLVSLNEGLHAPISVQTWISLCGIRATTRNMILRHDEAQSSLSQ